MLKRFLCVYAAAFYILTLQAEDQLIQDSNPAAEIVLPAEEAPVESTEKNLLVTKERVTPGALACDCSEENCQGSHGIVEEIPSEGKVCEEQTAGLIACSKCE